jgi:hypothetical protein
LNDAKKEMDGLVEYLKELINTCDTVGKQAFQAKHMLPKEIFDNYYTGAKKSAEEIAAMDNPISLK